MQLYNYRFSDIHLLEGASFNFNIMRKITILLVLSLIATLSSCDDILPVEDNTLKVEVSVPEYTKALINSYLPSASAIGVSLTEAGKETYDKRTYKNIKYTSSGSGSSQQWTSTSKVLLSPVQGTAVAYYPFKEGMNLSSIPLDGRTNTDYLYAKYDNISSVNPKASFKFNHALTCIRFKIKKGSYISTGRLSSVSIASSTLSPTGVLNAATGKVTLSSAGTKMSKSYSSTISSTPLQCDFLAVSSLQNGTITLSITVDGVVLNKSITIVSGGYRQGVIYSYDINVDANNISISNVTVNDWQYNDTGTTIIQPNNLLKISFNSNDIMVSVKEESEKLIIQAQSPIDYKICQVTTTLPHQHRINGQLISSIEINKRDINKTSTMTIDITDASIYKTSFSTYGGETITLSSFIEDNNALVYVDWTGGISFYDLDYGSISTLSYKYPTISKKKTYEITIIGSFTKIIGSLENINLIVLPYPESFIKMRKNTSVKHLIGPIVSNSLSDLNLSFHTCSELLSIQKGFLDKCPNINSFIATFMNCEKLEYVPADLFNNITCTTPSFKRTFYDDNMIHSTVPELWELFPNATKFSPYFGCDNIINIDNIPLDWN